jgi:hypothetical protein
MTQRRELSLVAVCILLQTLDAFLNQATEPSADIESLATFQRTILDGHCELPGSSA